jgi:lysyl-tRNA synthetase class 2
MSDPDFRPTATWKNLELRADMLKRLRSFFDARGFLEVDTPLLSRDTVVDVHIDPIAVEMLDGHRLYLQTSPEFAMKRLVASGATAIYQVTHAFRAGESGALHNNEFTMAEWYQTELSMSQAMQFLSELSAALLDRGPAQLVTFADAFEQHAGINPHTAACAELVNAAKRYGLVDDATPLHDERDIWLDRLLTQVVEPKLGVPTPTIVYDYPADQAALATVRDGELPVAERFELYVDGIELANGYHELLDANTLRQRNRDNSRHRLQLEKSILPEDSRLLDAMDHGLPQCCGVALGFDRLVMIATGAKNIREVMAFPTDRA